MRKNNKYLTDMSGVIFASNFKERNNNVYKKKEKKIMSLDSK